MQKVSSWMFSSMDACSDINGTQSVINRNQKGMLYSFAWAMICQIL